MTTTKKMLLIMADDHPRIRALLESLLVEYHSKTTLYTAADPRELMPLTESRLATASKLTVADICLAHTETTQNTTSDIKNNGDPDQPLMVVSLKERGITANWFAPIDPVTFDGSDKRMAAALDQRKVVMELIHSLRSATHEAGASDPEPTPAPPSTTSLMRLGLTERQAEVLVWLAEGLTNKEIARKLDVSEWTVRHHVSAILERLEVSNRGRAAMFARTLGSA